MMYSFRGQVNRNLIFASVKFSECMYVWIYLMEFVVLQTLHFATGRMVQKFIIHQWRREDFGSGGGEHLATKRLSRAHRRGSGGEGPRTVAKVKLLKRFKVLENESIFQKYQHFSCPKTQFFQRKLSKN